MKLHSNPYRAILLIVVGSLFGGGVMYGAVFLVSDFWSASKSASSSVVRSSVEKTTAPVPQVIPDLRGENGWVALDKLEMSGFTNVTNADEDGSSVFDPENWYVLRSSPAAGTAIGPDSELTVFLTRTNPQAAQQATSRPSEEPNASEEPKTSEEPEGITDGTYLVGEDVEPGTYKTEGPAGGVPCYWERLSNTTGGAGSILANGMVRGPSVVTIKNSDAAFHTERCAPWIKQ